MGGQFAQPRKEWPKEIAVEPARLAMGIWGEAEGDIQEAYSTSIFPKVRAFAHEGHLFTNCGGLVERGMDCYPLIPESAYEGAEPKEFTYEGRACIYRREKMKLGSRVAFMARERSPEEWANQLRRQYAHGGMFAAGKTYAEVLRYFADRNTTSEAERSTIERELAGPDLPITQAEMLERLSGETNPCQEAANAGKSQLTLPGL